MSPNISLSDVSSRRATAFRVSSVTFWALFSLRWGDEMEMPILRANWDVWRLVKQQIGFSHIAP